MAGIEKREDGWYAEGSGPFTSRDAARQAIKKADQAEAEDTYAENLAATEVLDGSGDTEATELVQQVAEEEEELSDGSVVRETAKQVRERENVVFMALYANTAPARAYWRHLAESRGYELPAETQDTEDATV